MGNPLKNLKPFLIRHEPEVLMAMGISGMIFSTVWAVKATVKAAKVVHDYKESKQIDKVTKKELVSMTWKYYIPVVGSMLLSVPCIIAGNQVGNKRYAALAAAYTISETALQEYKDKTLEIVGDKKEQQIREAISKDKVASTYEGGTQIIMTGNGESLFYEPISGRYFKSNWNDINKAANDLNAKALSDPCGHTTLNEWFEKLGLEPTSIGEDIGWELLGGFKSSMIDISISSHLTKDNIPCGAIEYRRQPSLLKNSLY